MNPNSSPTYWAFPSNEEVPSAPLSEINPEGIPLCLSPPHLLIVDDVPDIRLFFRESLVKYGYSCEEAQHGLEALRKLQACHYDIILTDLQMPFLDGFELAKYIRQDPSLGNPMVIMMTASDAKLLAPLALALGIKKILSKPCMPSTIHQVNLDEQGRFPHAP